MKVAVRTRTVVLSILAGAAVSMRAAAETSNLLYRTLLEKGVLNESDVRRMEAADAARAAEPPAPQYPTVRIGGRLMLDAAGYRSDDHDFNDGVEVRRARVRVRGNASEEWSYNFLYDFVDSAEAGIRDLFFGYSPHKASWLLRIGQYTEPGALEDRMSSGYITFMERSLPMLAFEPSPRHVGAGVDAHGGMWSAAAGVFGDSLADDESVDEGLGAKARAALAPLHDPGRVVHVGAFAGWRAPRQDTVSFGARPESHVDDTALVDTGDITNVSARVESGAELAIVRGPLSFQAEGLAVAVDRDGADTLMYGGHYEQVSWFVTGESRAYDVKTGEFTRIQPLRPRGRGGLGALELAARYSGLDLNDEEVRGGRQDDVTLGINWYTTPYSRFMVNYVRASATRDSGDVDADIIQARAQMEF